jgi:hypothetical protein
MLLIDDTKSLQKSYRPHCLLTLNLTKPTVRPAKLTSLLWLNKIKWARMVKFHLRKLVEKAFQEF